MKLTKEIKDQFVKVFREYYGNNDRAPWCGIWAGVEDLLSNLPDDTLSTEELAYLENNIISRCPYEDGRDAARKIITRFTRPTSDGERVAKESFKLEPLSEDLRKHAETSVSQWQPTHPVHLVAAELLRRCVKQGAKEPGPFVLSPVEKHVVESALSGEPGALKLLASALDRACRTLGPQAVPAPTGDVLTGDAARLPRIYMDGNMWCVLLGENIQEGVCGFGATPQEAMDEYALRLGEADTLTSDERAYVENLRWCFTASLRPDALTLAATLKTFDRIAPAPKPVEKTNEELAEAIAEEASSWSRAQEAAIEELVRRANQGAGK